MGVDRKYKLIEKPIFGRPKFWNNEKHKNI